MFEINYHWAVILCCILAEQHPGPGKSQNALWKLGGVANRGGLGREREELRENMSMQQLPGDVKVINALMSDWSSLSLVAHSRCLPKISVRSCELAGSLAGETIPYASAPLRSVPLPFPSPNENQ